MLDQLSLPTQEDLVKLPPRAIIAYAIRCARRIHPFLGSKKDFEAYGKAVDEPLQMAERCCRGEKIRAEEIVFTSLAGAGLACEDRDRLIFVSIATDRAAFVARCFAHLHLDELSPGAVRVRLSKSVLRFFAAMGGRFEEPEEFQEPVLSRADILRFARYQTAWPAFMSACAARRARRFLITDFESRADDDILRACRADSDRLLALYSTTNPDFDPTVDPTESGPLGPLWPEGPPKWLTDPVALRPPSDPARHAKSDLDDPEPEDDWDLD